MERLEKYKLVKLIETRIRDEYRKHKEIEWELIAASKIASTIIKRYLEPRGKAKAKNENKGLHLQNVTQLRELLIAFEVGRYLNTSAQITADAKKRVDKFLKRNL